MDLFSEVDRARRAGETEFEIDISGYHAWYPDGMTPLICAVNSWIAEGEAVSIVPPDGDGYDFWERAGWQYGLFGHAPPIVRPGTNLTPLTAYSSGSELNEAVTEAISVMSTAASFPSGVVDSLSWTLNEVADNVLVHSNAERGWMQVSYQPRKGLLDFVVADSGRGILASLRESFSHLRTDIEALNLAVEKGITRNRHVGQGNGLSGLVRIAVGNRGFVNLHSGTGQLRILEGEVRQAEDFASPFGGTIVTMTLRTDQPIDLSEALWGHEPVPSFERQYLADAGIHFRVASEASNFGNRSTGRLLRLKVGNIITTMPDEPLMLDFTGVELASASFCDEFVAKLVLELGPVSFFSRVHMTGYTPLIRRTLDHVIAQRLATAQSDG